MLLVGAAGVASAQITDIADIQAAPASYDGTVVTVEGQVYVPSNYRGSTISGYIQDESGRGINLYGDGADVSALQDTGNIVQVTGEVDLYFTTVEIVNISDVTLVSSGNPELEPEQLSTGAAADSEWEGTFIEIQGRILSQAVGGPGVNYTVNDGSGPIVVRVVDTLGAPSFGNGKTIIARGAGGQYQDDYQVLVGSASDVYEAGAGPDTTPPTVVSAAAGDETEVTVTFNEALDATTAEAAGNYSVYETATPANTVSVSSASLSGAAVTLTLGSALTSDTGYTVEVQNVEDAAGNPIAASNTATFTYTAVATTSIAVIQADPDGYDGQVVTVQGQVYIPSDYRGTTISGYIQGASGRGINVFGSTADVAALQDIGNIVQVTGEIDVYFTTVEIIVSDVVLVSSGNDPLTPLQLSTGAAANSNYEGTFIEVTGEIISQAVGGPGTNYTVNDGSGPIVVRVVDPLGAASFSNGTTITARGAGGQYQDDYQVNVGFAADVFEYTGGTDTTPPTVVSVAAASETQLTVGFSEALDETGAETVTNYSVYETATPANAISVTAASLSGTTVTLTLASALVEETGYTIVVTNVEDGAGNAIGASNSASFTYTASGATPIADVHENLAYWTGRDVTVRGQVFLPGDYLGVRTSGYIQDASGRGINVFSFDMGQDAVYDIGNIVEVTGEVTLYGTTVEIVMSDLTLISADNPPLQPLDLATTAQANDSDYEGTYIRVSGEIQSISENGTSPVHTNYTISDGTSPVIVRVAQSFGAPVFDVGDVIWAAGAGSQFGSDFQVLVGLTSDLTDEEPADTSPPVLMQVYQNAPEQITLRFNEELDEDSAEDVANYTINVPAKADVTVVLASYSGQGLVVLTLSEEIDLDAGWTVSVTGVADTEGNTSTIVQTAEIEPEPATKVTLDGPINTFLPREGEEYPITMNLLPSMVAAGAQTEVSLRIFDMQGRLVLNLYDSRFMPDVQGDFEDESSHTVVWNGRDEFFDLVPAGAYVAHLSVTESTTGKRHQAQMPVVVATRLER